MQPSDLHRSGLAIANRLIQFAAQVTTCRFRRRLGGCPGGVPLFGLQEE